MTQAAITPTYEWDPRIGRYRDKRNGRLVPRQTVRDAIDQFIAKGDERIQKISRDLVEGRSSLATWQTQMMLEIRHLHLANAAAAVGGWDQLTSADFGRVGQLLKVQYAYLQRFALQIQTGQQQINGGLITRAGMYADAARGTYEDELRALSRDRLGMTQERRVLGRADHCDDCLTAAAKDWQPIGTLPRIGDSACKVSCRCSFEYR